MKPELKKLLLLNLPYLLFVYLFAKCGQAYRLAAGADASAKLLHLTSGISAAFANPLPSLHPFDLCVGVIGAVAVRLIVYSKAWTARLSHVVYRMTPTTLERPYLNPDWVEWLMGFPRKWTDIPFGPKNPPTSRA